MKKFLAIILAVIMVCSMSVFAFAATLDKTTPSGNVIIKTATTDGEGKDANRYSIKIPADTVIPWETEATSLSYDVESHLGHKQAVKVTVSGNNKMTYAPDPTATPYELPYELSGDTEFTADRPNIYPAETKNISVDISAENWKSVVVGEYSDTLTFTAEIVTAA